MDQKTCSMCYETKPFTCYVKDKTGKFGLRANCKECSKSIKKEHYQANKEKYKQAYQDFMIENPDYFKNYKRNKYIKKVS
jgi:hypothetical protein